MDIKWLLGRTLSSCGLDPKDSDAVRFVSDNGRTLRLGHHQECCERVELVDVCGSLDDLVGSPIVEAEVVTEDHDGDPDARDAVCMWTFYKLGTARGCVTLRWVGESNGYYGVEVDFEEVVQ